MSDNSVLGISGNELFRTMQDLLGHIHDHVIDLGAVYHEFTPGTANLVAMKSGIGRGRPSGKVIDFLSNILGNAVHFAVSGNILAHRSFCTQSESLS